MVVEGNTASEIVDIERLRNFIINREELNSLICLLFACD